MRSAHNTLPWTERRPFGDRFLYGLRSLVCAVSWLTLLVVGGMWLAEGLPDVDLRWFDGAAWFPWAPSTIAVLGVALTLRRLSAVSIRIGVAVCVAGTWGTVVVTPEGPAPFVAVGGAVLVALGLVGAPWERGLDGFWYRRAPRVEPTLKPYRYRTAAQRRRRERMSVWAGLVGCVGLAAVGGTAVWTLWSDPDVGGVGWAVAMVVVAAGGGIVGVLVVLVAPYRPLPTLDRTPRTAVVTGFETVLTETDEGPSSSHDLIAVDVEVDGTTRSALVADVVAAESFGRFAIGTRWLVHVFAAHDGRVLLAADHDDVVRIGHDLRGVRDGLRAATSTAGPGSDLLLWRFRRTGAGRRSSGPRRVST